LYFSATVGAHGTAIANTKVTDTINEAQKRNMQPMNILCCASAPGMLEKISKAAIALSIDGVGIELYKSIEEVCDRLCKPNASTPVLILCPKSKKETEKIISMLDVLSDAKIILVLPKRDRDLVKMAYRIFPRYMTFADEDFANITMVLKKMSGSFAEQAAQG
jgi:hypothetical protein